VSTQLPIEFLWLSRLLNCYAKQPVVADIGSGKGKKASYIAQNNAYTMLIDINYYQEFRKINLIYGYNVDIILADAQHLPLRDEAIDMAILWNLLMFVNNDKQVIYHTARTLREHAMLLLSTYTVQSGKKNYSANTILRLLRPYFYMYHVKILSGEKQVKIIAVRMPHKKRYIVIKVDVARLIRALDDIYKNLYKNNIDLDKKAIILIPLKSKTSGVKRYLWIRKTNFISFSILGELIKRTSFRNIAEWLTKRLGSKCLYDSNEIDKILSELNLNKTYIEKFANDLMRLGILSPATGSPLALELCEYIPSYKTVKKLRYTPYIVECNIANPECLVGLLWNYNPVMRKILETILQYRDVSIEMFKDVARRILADTLMQCHGIVHKHKEYEMLKDVDYVRERIIKPLHYLNIIDQYSNGERLYVKYFPLLKSTLQLV
jgi:ubiquinone/menaquinone biosynthesis C-methylase UbiE